MQSFLLMADEECIPQGWSIDKFHIPKDQLTQNLKNLKALNVIFNTDDFAFDIVQYDNDPTLVKLSGAGYALAFETDPWELADGEQAEYIDTILEEQFNASTLDNREDIKNILLEIYNNEDARFMLDILPKFISVDIEKTKNCFGHIPRCYVTDPITNTTDSYEFTGYSSQTTVLDRDNFFESLTKTDLNSEQNKYENDKPAYPDIDWDL